ncbi:MAG: hypothetical protein ACRDGI_04565 [Candidatus Limnocylindrales bacterium]
MQRIVVVAVISTALVAVACNVGTSSPDPRDALIEPLLAGNVEDGYASEAWYPSLQRMNGLPNIRVSVDGCGDAVPPCGGAIIFTSIPNTTSGQSSAAIICGDVVKADYGPNMSVTLGLGHFEVDGGSGNEKLASCDASP